MYYMYSFPFSKEEKGVVYLPFCYKKENTTILIIKWIIIDYWCLNWVHLVIKMPNLENLEFYTCTLLDHNAKF